MLRNEEIARIDSCLNRAKDDEPIFVLRANDELAAGIVRSWASTYYYSKRRENANEENPRGFLTHAQQKKYDEALRLADAMEAYRPGATK